MKKSQFFNRHAFGQTALQRNLETISGLKIQNTWAFQYGNWTIGKQQSFGSGNSKDLWESVGANQSKLVVGSEDVEKRSWSSWRKNNNIIQ